MSKKRETKHSRELKYICKLAILTALATVLTIVEFNVPVFPEFYKIDFSSVIVMTGSFALGPMAGIIMTILKNILKVVFFGTKTAFVGEYTDVIITIIYIFPASVIYHNRKSIKSAIVGMAVGIVCMTVCASFVNYYLLIPVYSNIMGVSIDSIVAMGSAVNRHVTSLRTLIIWATVPFNILKGILCSAITFLLYKRVSKILHV